MNNHNLQSVLDKDEDLDLRYVDITLHLQDLKNIHMMLDGHIKWGIQTHGELHPTIQNMRTLNSKILMTIKDFYFFEQYDLQPLDL